MITLKRDQFTQSMVPPFPHTKQELGIIYFPSRIILIRQRAGKTFFDTNCSQFSQKSCNLFM